MRDEHTRGPDDAREAIRRAQECLEKLDMEQVRAALAGTRSGGG